MDRMNENPRMLKHLIAAGVFAQHPWVVVDVGARDGASSVWNLLGDQVRIIGFDADPEECRRLAALHPRHRYFPFALHRDKGRRVFHIAREPAASSFYDNAQAFARIGNYQYNQRVRDVELDTTTLDLVCEQEGIDRIDFIKLDTESSELDILIGSENVLRRSGVLAIESEVKFQNLPADTPTYSDVDTHLRQRGFFLFDVSLCRFGRRDLPLPNVWDIRDSSGVPVPGITTIGQVIVGDALFCRDLVREAEAKRPGLDGHQILKQACIFELYGLPDCAAELLVQFRAELTPLVDVQRLLDLLTPAFFPAVDRYEEYMRRAGEAFGRDKDRVLARTLGVEPMAPVNLAFYRDLRRNGWMGRPSPLTYARIIAKLLLGFYHRFDQ